MLFDGYIYLEKLVNGKKFGLSSDYKKKIIRIKVYNYFVFVYIVKKILIHETRTQLLSNN